MWRTKTTQIASWSFLVNDEPLSITYRQDYMGRNRAVIRQGETVVFDESHVTIGEVRFAKAATVDLRLKSESIRLELSLKHRPRLTAKIEIDGTEYESDHSHWGTVHGTKLFDFAPVG